MEFNKFIIMNAVIKLAKIKLLVFTNIKYYLCKVIMLKYLLTFTNLSYIHLKTILSLNYFYHLHNSNRFPLSIEI